MGKFLMKVSIRNFRLHYRSNNKVSLCSLCCFMGSARSFGFMATSIEIRSPDI